MISVAFYNLKGGVGKTTTAVNMAWLAAAANKQTVLWDLDPQAAATWFFQQNTDNNRAIKLLDKGRPVAEMVLSTPFANLTVIPADLSLRKLDKTFNSAGESRKLFKGLQKALSEKADVLIYDCPPTLSPAMEQVLSDVDILLIPMIPNPLSIRAMEQVIHFFESRKQSPRRIVGFFNQVDLRRRMHRQAIESLRKMPVTMLKTWIPTDAAVEQMALRQAPLASYSGSGRAAPAYAAMWKEIARLLRQSEQDVSAEGKSAEGKSKAANSEE